MCVVEYCNVLLHLVYGTSYGICNCDINLYHLFCACSLIIQLCVIYICSWHIILICIECIYAFVLCIYLWPFTYGIYGLVVYLPVWHNLILLLLCVDPFVVFISSAYLLYIGLDYINGMYNMLYMILYDMFDAHDSCNNVMQLFCVHLCIYLCS